MLIFCIFLRRPPSCSSETYKFVNLKLFRNRLFCYIGVIYSASKQLPKISHKIMLKLSVQVIIVTGVPLAQGKSLGMCVMKPGLHFVGVVFIIGHGCRDEFASRKIMKK